MIFSKRAYYCQAFSYGQNVLRAKEAPPFTIADKHDKRRERLEDGVTSPGTVQGEVFVITLEGVTS